MRFQKTRILTVFFSLVLILTGLEAQAGVFNMSRFVVPGEFAIGFEPELDLNSDAGIGATARYTRGLSEMINATALVGIGGGAKRFRMGGNLAFDIFPDAEGQPGFGIGAQTIYTRYPGFGQLEMKGVPYMHKSFLLEGQYEFEPFVSLPVGVGFRQKEYSTLANMAIGAIVKTNATLSWVIEFGVNISNTPSYFSGGIVYQPN